MASDDGDDTFNDDGTPDGDGEAIADILFESGNSCVSFLAAGS